MSHNSAAKSARLSKERNPHFYCPERDCLWRTYDARTDSFSPCGKHGALHIDAVKREELQREVESIVDDFFAFEAAARGPESEHVYGDPGQAEQDALDFRYYHPKNDAGRMMH